MFEKHYGSSSALSGDDLHKLEFRQDFLVLLPVWLQCDWHGPAEDEMWVKGQYHSAMGRLVFPSMPEDALLPRLKTRHSHKNTERKDTKTAQWSQAEVREDY